MFFDGMNRMDGMVNHLTLKTEGWTMFWADLNLNFGLGRFIPFDDEDKTSH